MHERQKVNPQIKKVIENKLRLGQGRTEIRHKIPQLTENINASTSKSCEIQKIPITQNVARIEWIFQCENNQ